MDNEVLITTRHLVKQYPIGGRKFTALEDINLSIERGEFTGLVGPSGSGKTTLLNIIGALDDPTEGHAVVIGQDTRVLSHKQAAKLRSEHLGFIFQTYNLLPVYNVFENVEFPLLLLRMSDAERRKLVMQALEWRSHAPAWERECWTLRVHCRRAASRPFRRRSVGTRT